ncbi:MAG: DUF4926 domain-containing protein [Desulfatiglandaceae bacterium]
MFNELDMVVLTKEVARSGLKRGDIGAVVHCYESGEAFEVEFVTGRGDTIGVFTLEEVDIRPIGEREVLHARELQQVAFG